MAYMKTYFFLGKTIYLLTETLKKKKKEKEKKKSGERAIKFFE